MSTNDSLKRKSDVMENKSTNEESPEPDPKQIKIDDSSHNLKNQTSNNDSAKGLVDSESTPCCITIKFHDEVTAEAYKRHFLKFLTVFKEFHIRNESDFFIHIHRDNNAVPEPPEDYLSDTNSIQTPTCTKKRKKHSKVKKELFVVDATPSDNSNSADLRYTTKFTVNAARAAENEAANQSSKGQCFNCGEKHSLRDCPQPKDYARIAMARQKFKFQTKSARYHLEEQKYEHLHPGKISSELRRALGLQKHEEPHYVYMMRKWGYPPGWLEEAKFVHSNLDLFDIDGKHVKGGSVKKRGLDEKKIVEYPGFNVPFPKGTRDEYRMHRVPPFSDNFSKQAMINFFDKKYVQAEDDLEVHDMDIDQPCLGVRDDKIADLKKKPGRNSPSLIDLEQQKRQLLEELNEEPIDEKKDSDSDAEKGFLAIKTSFTGTPLLKSNSPYSKLPNPDNFSKDVSPVINFENLPNSTGKYEQLTDVLQKVRDTMKKVQNCST